MTHLDMLNPVGHWEFVGRHDDLTRLRSAADDVSGRGMVLSGLPGIGKSRLLHEAVRTLAGGRFAVRVAAASTASPSLPFGGLAQVLPGDPPAGLSRAGLLRWAVDSIHVDAGDDPILLAVDDAHLLDPPSAALANLLVREGVTLLATVRSGEPVPAPLTALWTEGMVGHAELAPLTAEESRDLLAAMVGAPVEAASAHRMVTLAAGNPLLLRELVTAARDGGEMTSAYRVWRWTGRLHLAPSLADLVKARIGGLTPGVRQVLELVAFGAPLGLPLLCRACDPADIEEAEERGLIRIAEVGRRRDVRLVHPLYGEVLRRQCPVTRSERLLSTLAELVEQAGARRAEDLLQMALWRLDAGAPPDPAGLLAAAAQAFGRLDLEPARRLADAARQAGAGYDAAELLATALLFADRPDEAMAVLDRDTGGPPARRITARATVAFWGLGRPDAADELAAARAGTAAGQAPMRAVEALMRLQLNQTGPARALAGEVLADPSAGRPARVTARCVQACL
ncbi:MAG TPA: AAA family ATPase, partial [Actinoplanes sp.]|nr:AAA family ATPase [Actinoplanes sp.]